MANKNKWKREKNYESHKNEEILKIGVIGNAREILYFIKNIKNRFAFQVQL